MIDSSSQFSTDGASRFEDGARGAYSVAEFCRLHGNITRQHFYNMIKRGIGPQIFKVGGRTLISVYSAAKWMEEQESITRQDSLV